MPEGREHNEGTYPDAKANPGTERLFDGSSELSPDKDARERREGNEEKYADAKANPGTEPLFDGSSELLQYKDAREHREDNEGKYPDAKANPGTEQLLDATPGGAGNGKSSVTGTATGEASLNKEISPGKARKPGAEGSGELSVADTATGEASSNKELSPGNPREPDAEGKVKSSVTDTAAGYRQAAKTGGMPARSNKTPNGEFIFVQNCGIVLLHPFLAQYFGELGLLDNKHFADAAAQKRCLLLLHYLATGANIAAEFDLTLQKIMCGIPINEPVPNEAEFTEREKTEAENLLKAVTLHWKPLNNTSVEGLRTTFLQREGKMKQTDTGWKLQIPAKTVDVLIGKLPWGYSTIRLPWMGNLLHVEWY